MTIAANTNPAIPPAQDKMDPGFGKKERPDGGKSAGPLPHDAVRSIVDTSQPRADKRTTTNPAPKSDAKVERVVYCIVLSVIAIVPLLAFLFSFGNVGDLGIKLGIDQRIAYLTGPAVDLSVTGLIVAATWLSYRGWTERRLWPVHLLSILCGLIMFALNCGQALYESHYGRAAFDAVGPFLLAAWGFVGPWLLRQLAEARQGNAGSGSGTAEAAPAAAPARPAAAAPEAAPAIAAPTPAIPAAAANPATATGTPGGTTPRSGGTGNDSRTATIVPIDGNDRRPSTDWAALALPLVRRWIETHGGERPTAPVVANLLRNAHPDLKVPGSERSERNIRAAVEKLLEDGEGSDEAEPALWQVSS